MRSYVDVTYLFLYFLTCRYPQKQLVYPRKSPCSVTSTSRSRWNCSVRHATDWPAETVSCLSTRTISMLSFCPFSGKCVAKQMGKKGILIFMSDGEEKFVKVTFPLNVHGFHFQLPVFGGCIQEPQTLPGEHDPPIAGEKKRNRRDVELHQQRVPIARVFFLFNYPNDKLSFVDGITWGVWKV